MKKLIKPLLFFGVIFALLSIGIALFAPETTRLDPNIGYKGRLMKKTFNGHSSYTLTIKTDTADVQVSGIMTTSLIAYMQVGDTLHKVKNQNICYVIRQGKRKKFLYVD